MSHRSCLAALSLLLLGMRHAVAAEEKKGGLLVEATPSVFLRVDGQYGEGVAMSPDGKYLVADLPRPKGSSELVMFDRASKKIVHRLPRPVPCSVFFSMDGSRFGCAHMGRDLGSREWLLVHVYDFKTGKRLVQIPLRQEPHNVGRVGTGGSPEAPYAVGGDILVYATASERYVRQGLDLIVIRSAPRPPTVYSLKTGKPLGDLPGPLRVDRMDVSRDGRWLLTLEGKRTLRVWDVQKRKLDRLLYESMYDVESIAISPDGKWCAAKLDNKGGHVEVFDRATGKGVAYTDLGLRSRGLAFTADGKRLVGRVARRPPKRYPGGPLYLGIWEHDMGLRLWDWEKDTPPRSVVSRNNAGEAGMGMFYPQVMTADGSTFASWGGREGVMILDLHPRKPPPGAAPRKNPEKK